MNCVDNSRDKNRSKLRWTKLKDESWKKKMRQSMFPSERFKPTCNHNPSKDCILVTLGRVAGLNFQSLEGLKDCTHDPWKGLRITKDHEWNPLTFRRISWFFEGLKDCMKSFNPSKDHAILRRVELFLWSFSPLKDFICNHWEGWMIAFEVLQRVNVLRAILRRVEEPHS